MFSFFKKEKQPKVIDQVYLSGTEKISAFLSFLRTTTNVVVLTWFDSSREQLETACANEGIAAEVISAAHVRSHEIRNRQVIFFEHYPLLTPELSLLKNLNLSEAVFYVALDEPLLLHFGGERILSLAKQLGMKENEALSHPFITKSIRNAQEKLEQKIQLPRSAYSPADWFARNVG